MNWLFRLLEWIAYIIPRDKNLETYEAALKAISAGDKAGVEELLREKPALIDLSYCISGSLLHNAAMDGEVDIAQMLIAKGAIVNDATTRDRETPLHFAAYRGQLAAARLLLENGADLEAMAYGRTTAVEIAADHGHAELTRALIQLGARHSLLHLGAALGDVHMLQEAVASGADLNASDSNGQVALLLATAKGNTSAVAYLIDAGASVNVRDRQGRTALHIAVEQGCRDLSELLIRSGADLNTRDTSGRSALDVAVGNHNIDLARLLVDSGADISVHAAALIGDTEHLSTDRGISTQPGRAGLGPDADPLHLAAESGNPEAVAALLAQGADVHGKDRYGQTALHYAARGDHTQIVDALIAKGANIEAGDTLGRTPLHKAAEGEANSAIARLIELGANINARDSEGSTPLLIAAILSDTAETVRLLLDLGADTDIPRKSGLTPLAAAIENGHAASAEVLRQHSTG